MPAVPNKSVVIYDGQCRFCIEQVGRLERRDRDGRIEFLPFPSTAIDERFPHLREMDINAGMRFVTPQGDIFVGADALHQIARELPRWRWIAWLYRVPCVSPIAKAVYAWIAARRHRFAASKTTCENSACAREP
ncbi:MAG TPA: DUF393 domain-containing protein [Phycisphaerales bacterium]|nr:DUF393 domain-containing protein [Phycisphaerales bacterium]HRQ74817.1 DUF393 domain-containing protein [Phycisphaerales bacterium]